MRGVGLALWVAVWAGLSACSAKSTPSVALEACLSGAAQTDCRAQADVRLLTPAKKVTNQLEVDVQAGGVPIGGTVDLDFQIVNTISVQTAAVLRVSDITLSPGDTSGAYACTSANGTACNLMAGKWQPIVPAGGNWPNTVNSETFHIHYKKLDAGIHTAQVCIQASGDPALPAGGLCFKLATRLGKPSLNWSPKLIDFGHVLTGSAAPPQDVALFNAGDAPLTIRRLDLSGDKTFAVVLADGVTHTVPNGFDVAGLSLDPGKSATISVRFSATDSIKKSGQIQIHSNDPAQPIAKVDLSANADVPCLQILQSPELAFGAVVVGQLSTLPIELKNCGTGMLGVTAVTLVEGANPAFVLDFGSDVTPSAATPRAIAQNASYKFKATYTPAAVSEEVAGVAVKDVALVQVDSNADPKQLKLTGVGVTAACPKAILKVKEGEEVVPQTVLHLSGEQSSAPGGGQITKYKWTVKKQPQGSNQKFVPSSASPEPTFVVNAAGEYDFCLKVVDDKGVTSCNEACTTVIVTPSDCLHAELLWHTPGDADEPDMGQGLGADMDLHLAHQLANQPDIDCDGEPDPWFDTTFDCFWWVSAPHWGVASTDQQSPKLDLDDTDGAGPENMSLPQPEGSTSDPHIYPLGVHYWNEHTFGHSWAIVRVYVCGALAAEYNQPHPDQPAGDGVELKNLDFWYVGKINWPNQAVGGSGPVMTTCYQTGDSCLGKKDPSDPKGGKMWQPKGDWCVTPCYISGNAPPNQSFCGK